ncbi:hypothetical protein [Helicobacter brantae]|uniref:Uncharacterized protein n=1 Tax=Helicobacter brantae TaxID=375927 RepID=A0A3D8IZG8_9HELI|nr:hypothetical protein [Helicobacter brantae]RDU70667.1 hypothetical protein CQA58_04825 [Helicobacter brantae]
MNLELKIFTLVVFIVGIFSSIIEIASLFLSIDMNFSFLFYIAFFIQIILLYFITKEQKIFYWSGAYVFFSLLFGMGVKQTEELDYMFYIYTALTLLFGALSAYTLYKLYTLLYTLTQQSVFKYALVFSIIGIIVTFFATTLQGYTLKEEISMLLYLWLMAYVFDILDTTLYSIGVFRANPKI